MSTSNIVPQMARLVRGKPAQESLLSAHPHHSEALAANAVLDRELWFRLALKAPVTVSYQLASHPLDAEQLAVLLKDKRVTLRRQLVSTGMKGCSDAMARMLIDADWFDTEYARYWLIAGSVPESLRKQVAIIENGNELVRALSDEQLFSDEEAKALLLGANLNDVRTTLYRLLDLRPSLATFAAGAGSSQPRLVEAAAGSRHLFDREIFTSIVELTSQMGGSSHHASEINMTLLVNPNLPIDLYHLVERRIPRSVLDRWNRHRPRGYQLMLVSTSRRRQRHPEAIATAWELTVGGDAEQVIKALEDLGLQRYPSLSAWHAAQGNRAAVSPKITPSDRGSRSAQRSPVSPVDLEVAVNLTSGSMRFDVSHVEAVGAALDPYGQSAWETFWSLVETWQGTLQELITASVNLAQPV